MTISQPLDVPGDPGAGYRITRIGTAGVGDFLAVWNECATWLTARGIDQWAPVDPTPERVAALAVKTTSKEWYLIHCENELAGAFILRWDDPETWGEQPPDAAYVHSLCVRRQFAGRAVGHAMLDWAGRRVAAQGRSWLRLD
jgi:protein-tyrosine phosphatase